MLCVRLHDVLHGPPSGVLDSAACSVLCLQMLGPLGGCFAHCSQQRVVPWYYKVAQELTVFEKVEETKQLIKFKGNNSTEIKTIWDSSRIICQGATPNPRFSSGILGIPVFYRQNNLRNPKESALRRLLGLGRKCAMSSPNTLVHCIDFAVP